MTPIGDEYERRCDCAEGAPPFVRAVQYKVRDSFDGKYAFLNFCEKAAKPGRGLGVTIYAENVVAHTDQGLTKLSHGDWIARSEDAWYFVSDALFQRTYQKVAVQPQGER